MALTVTSTGNPIKVTGDTAASAAITDSDVAIKKILWVGATTDGHKLSLTDKNGYQIYEARMATTNLTESISETFGTPGLLSAGIYCDDMDSGTLYIYI